MGSAARGGTSQAQEGAVSNEEWVSLRRLVPLPPRLHAVRWGLVAPRGSATLGKHQVHDLQQAEDTQTSQQRENSSTLTCNNMPESSFRTGSIVDIYRSAPTLAADVQRNWSPLLM